MIPWTLGFRDEGHEREAAVKPSGDDAVRSKGFILWFTGLSGAGKSTLSVEVSRRLMPRHSVDILDGDEIRNFLSRGLGFTRPDREENIRRIGFVARRLARHGIAVLSAAISPYRDSRDEVRRLAAEEGIPFLEVYMQASLEVLIRRDVKGLYKKALAGEIPHFTGISDPYEPPESPEILILSDSESVEMSVARVLAVLEERGLTSPAR
ncbi:Adenylylsulfate kinase [Cystobacter fuscus DSM 2262]|uniref:Adenylyl-sulfate kinase n=1 Tax=Cystobacter fuscus (strain ATCC 25194 / DSM 2262 / NBRC 100088 / M29) TaxID=1242864 RepID=S9P903_CYSF2|nr:Adenylylsulfate kinase [Cystobacter fuscus DSM 2262]